LAGADDELAMAVAALLKLGVTWLDRARCMRASQLEKLAMAGELGE